MYYEKPPPGIDLTTADWEFTNAFKRSVPDETLALDWSRYPDNNYDMCRDIIAEKFSIERDNILLCNGCSEALQLLFFSQKIYNNEIYIPKRSFFIYYKFIKNLNLNAIYYDISDTEDIVSNGFRSAPVLICLPNNPTGEVVDIEKIVNLVKPGHIIFIDLTYAYFWDQFNKSLIQKLIYAGAILFISFSKAFALAGVRPGLVLSNNNPIANFNDIRFRFPMDFFQMATCKKLFEGKWYDYAINQIFLNKEERNKIASRLELKYGCDIYPLNCNFVSFNNKTPNMNDKYIRDEILYKFPCKIFKDGLVRLTVNRNVDYSEI